MRTLTGLLGSLPTGQLDRLRALGQDVAFPVGTRIFEEGQAADRFWVLHTGSVALDVRVPGRNNAVIERVDHGDLLGWSWMFPPFIYHLGAEAVTPVRAVEFEADQVRRLCDEEPKVGQAIVYAVARIVGSRLQASRTRLLDLFGPHGSGVLR